MSNEHDEAYSNSAKRQAFHLKILLFQMFGYMLKTVNHKHKRMHRITNVLGVERDHQRLPSFPKLGKSMAGNLE